MSQSKLAANGTVFEQGRVLMVAGPPRTESEIIASVRSGDKEAYREIVEKYMQRAYYIALTFVRDPDTAMDISQMAFIKAYKNLKRFDLERPFFPWFYRILRNLSLDHVRRARRVHEIPLEDVQIISDQREDRDMKEALWKAIEELPTEQREIIVLRYFEGFSYKEIAETVGKPIGTVMSSLYYSKRKLKTILGEFLGFER
jgi:RNA polymerase sigma-70 factor (ECF subfamily)